MSDRIWCPDDAMLYALAVGVGQDESDDELPFVTGNSNGHEQQVIPTYATVLAGERFPTELPIDLSRVVRAEQEMTLHRPLRPKGSVRTESGITEIVDKGTGSLIRVRTQLADAATGESLATTTCAWFARGLQGYGAGDPGGAVWQAPRVGPDEVVTYRTNRNQALLFSLLGDRHPLHSDPVTAREAGFPRPIMHGLCTLGFAARALLRVVCAGDGDRFGSVSARFTRPVFPGQELTVAIWREPTGGAHFRVTVEGNVVIDRGRFTLAQP